MKKGVHSMGASLMLQICPLFRLRLQTAYDYLALGGLVILLHTHKIKQPQDKQVWHTRTPAHRTSSSHMHPLINLAIYVVHVWIFSSYACASTFSAIMMTLYNVKPAPGFKYILQCKQQSSVQMANMF